MKNFSFNKTFDLVKNCAKNTSRDDVLFNILSWNVRCLSHKKLNIIKQYLDEWTREALPKKINENEMYEMKSLNGEKKNYFVDVICLTETWLRDEAKFNMYSIKGYSSFTVNRNVGKKGGGIMIYTRKSYATVVLDSCVNDDIEYLLVKIVAQHEIWHVLAIYRPNGSIVSFINTLESVISSLNSTNLIITGDMNLNIANPFDENVKKYVDMLSSINFHVTNSAVTRSNKITSSGSVIDHVALNKFHESFLTITSSGTDLVSDHNFILLIVGLTVTLPLKERIRRIKRINYGSAVSDIYKTLSDNNINPGIECPDLYFNMLQDEIIKSLDRNTRLVTVKLPSQLSTLPAWADDKYIVMLNTLYNLEEKIKKRQLNKLPCENLQHKFNELDILRDKFASVKAKIFYRKLEIDNLSHAWNIINNLLGRDKKKDAFVLKVDGDLIFNTQEIAEAFQSKFMSIVGAEPPSITGIEASSLMEHKYFGTLREVTFCFDEVTPFTIFTNIGALNSNKSTGCDGISAKFLKSANEGLCAHLANIFNNMIRRGKYTDSLKCAIVSAIPKNGKALDLENSRPISILPQIDKVFESILCCQLTNYFEDNEMLDPLQYGFRYGRGCRDVICKILNQISLECDDGRSVILISLDIRKAFDTVHHEILMRKLYFMGIRGPAHDLLNDFLKNRSQIVKVDDSYSSKGSICRGVPQGSNLGPLLFNLTINDLSSLTTYSTLYKYADDLVVLFPFEASQVSLNSSRLSDDLSKILDFYEMNGLEVNCSKSKFMTFGSKSECLEEMLIRSLMEQCNEMTYLGFIIDSELKLISQIDKICGSMASGINAIRFLRHSLTQQALLKFFHAHIQSHIHYCAFSLLRCRSIDIDRIQRLQSKALRLIFGLPDTYPSQQLFTNEAKKILPVTGIIYFSALTMIKKSLLSKDGSLPSVNRLRSPRSNDLQIGKARKRIMSGDITHTGCKLFNQIPSHINLEPSLSIFKQYLKMFILSRNESLIKKTQFAAKNFFI